MTTALSSAALFVGLWFLVPLVVAPLAVIAALALNSGRRPSRAQRQVTVHDLAASHPSDRNIRVICH